MKALSVLNIYDKENSMENGLLDGLKAIVQYRRKEYGHSWITMAAFDNETVAEDYVERCEEGNPPWEYRRLLIEENSDG
jgi:hypothetical protein